MFRGEITPRNKVVVDGVTDGTECIDGRRLD
jgi:hypothetical protein